MRRFRAFAVGMALLAGALALVVVQANREPRPRAPNERLRVVATTTIVADLVRELAGDRVDLAGLMRPGVDPHLYVASERDLDRLMSADVIVFNGLHLEGKVADLLEELDARGRPTVAVADGIAAARLRHADGFSGAHDPHVWFDVALWREGARHVADRLAALDPVGAPIYRAGAERYLAELDRLDAWVRAEVARVPPAVRVLVTAHDAFGYFGAAYGVEVAAIQGISTSTEAGSADLQELADLVTARRVPAVFLESSVPPRIVQALEAAVRARGFDVRRGGELYSDALGEPDGPAGTYVGMVRHNVSTIVRALRPATGADSGAQQDRGGSHGQPERAPGLVGASDRPGARD
jgi:manganese/zinc/iron transport system substrate-binding protein